MAGGRPPHYKTAEEIAVKIDEYFKQNKKKPTVTGLALFLGFCDRASVYDYAKREEFSHALKRAFTEIERFHEEMLSERSCTGSIFFLKNRGWNAEETIKQENTQKVLNLDNLTDEELNKLIAIVGNAQSGESEA